MPKLNPYLNFDGKAEEAFNFYKAVFGGEFMGPVMKLGDTPGSENIPEHEKNRVMHVALKIGNDILMASDIVPSMNQKLILGNQNYVSIFPDSREEADKFFKGLSAGGTVEMPMADQFWGDYFGCFTDKYGIGWMINFTTTDGYK